MRIRVCVADVWAESFESDEIEDLGDEVISLFCKDYNLKRTKEIEDLILWSAKSVIMGDEGFEIRPLQRKVTIHEKK